MHCISSILGSFVQKTLHSVKWRLIACTPVEYQFFTEATIIMINTPLALMFLYSTWRCDAAKPIVAEILRSFNSYNLPLPSILLTCVIWKSTAYEIYTSSRVRACVATAVSYREYCIHFCGACMTVDAWDAILQAWRSRFRIPTRQLNFFNLRSLSSRIMALGFTQPPTETSTRR
jgi:hypothetical protein